jgi:hypothetical protein
MSETEFPAPGAGAGINSQIEAHRAKPVVLHNSRIVCWTILAIGISAAFMALCMVIVVLTEIFPLSDLTAGKGLSAFQWALGALAMGSMCPWLWNMGRTMACYRVRLDSRGVDFVLGSRKKPQELFLSWDQVASVKHQRIGNIQYYFVHGTNGSEARFNSYTFFRPKKVARLIAERAGLVILEA